MLDELQRRNYAPNTVRSYIHAVEDFAKYFRRSPDRLGPNHIREYQVHLFRDCKLSAGTIEGRTAALRFLFVKTLRRPYLPDHIPFPKRQRRMPTVLSQEEVARLIASSQNLMHRTMLMTLYATGLRRRALKVPAFQLIGIGWLANLAYLLAITEGGASPGHYLKSLADSCDVIGASLFWYAAHKYGQ